MAFMGGTLRQLMAQQPAYQGAIINATNQGQSGGDDWFGANAPSANTGISGAGNATQAWDQNSFSQRFGTPNTPQELIALEPQLQAAGIKVLRNAEGTAGKIQLPNGQVVDVINAAGAGGRGFQWLTGDGGTGAASGSLGANNYSIFNTPTLEDFQKSPEYQAGLKFGTDAIQKSAAAKGTLLTGGTLKALQSYGQDYGAQQFGDFADRRQKYFQGNNSNLTALANMGRPQ